MLSSVFNSKEDINILVQRFIKKVDGCIKMNFKKVRINRTKKPIQKCYMKDWDF